MTTVCQGDLYVCFPLMANLKYFLSLTYLTFLVTTLSACGPFDQISYPDIAMRPEAHLYYPGALIKNVYSDTTVRELDARSPAYVHVDFDATGNPQAVFDWYAQQLWQLDQRWSLMKTVSNGEEFRLLDKTTLECFGITTYDKPPNEYVSFRYVFSLQPHESTAIPCLGTSLTTLPPTSSP